VLGPEERGSYFTLLHNGSFVRLFAAQAVSSLGDWVGVIAIAVYADHLGGPGGVGLVMAARVLPGFVVGPLAGVLADRWDRKRTMVAADVARALLIFSLPFVPSMIYLLVVSAALESLTLIWGPARDAALPNLVPQSELTHANSLSLLAIYGPWPVASLIYGLLSLLGGFLGDRVPVLVGLTDRPEALALWIDSVTFAFSAAMVTTLAIPSSPLRIGKLDLREAQRDLVEGLVFVRDHRLVRPWMLGIAATFTAAGGVFSLGPSFGRQVLGSSDRGFAFIIGTFAVGMFLGLLASGVLARKIRKDVLFSSAVVLLGAGIVALASVGSLDAAVPIASALGFFAGTGYSIGYSLLQETTEDDLRGRTFSAAYTIIRIGTLVGLSFFPSAAGIIGNHNLSGYPLPGTRITLWIAGLVVLAGGLQSISAVRHGRSLAKPEAPEARAGGWFVVFEGGESAGKTTQIAALARWLEGRGDVVVTTREPGGTAIGTRVRDILLDPEGPEMDARAEALLYAADRAQHVAEVIEPALRAGKIVVSDRFVDSSLAYQGVARGLGLEQIYEISSWATGGLVPDLVFFMKVDVQTAMDRMGDERDRIESEREDFHKRVGEAYGELAERFSERFVVLDATRPAEEIHREVVAAVQERILSARRPHAVGPVR
jgi:dTMP kinase